MYARTHLTNCLLSLHPSIQNHENNNHSWPAFVYFGRSHTPSTHIMLLLTKSLLWSFDIFTRHARMLLQQDDAHANNYACTWQDARTSAPRRTHPCENQHLRHLQDSCCLGKICRLQSATTVPGRESGGVHVFEVSMRGCVLGTRVYC
jgi:hypothetical protein